jgi:adsorption protein B
MPSSARIKVASRWCICYIIPDEAAGGARAKAVLLHDAEDVVHAAEPPLFDRLMDDFDFVQLPVLPLIDTKSRWIGGHYSDEFAEAHGKEMVVRAWLGAGLPSAGVGCAFSRAALERVARASDGLPFDADSLTEDYELGLRIAEHGGKAAFVRVAAEPGAALVATREFFPGTFAAAVRQKSRWLAGIALCGWDRMGWRGGVAERWMRLRDRQGLVAAVLLFAGYLAIALWLLLAAREGIFGVSPPRLPPALVLCARINVALLAWRLALRGAFVTAAYGWREGLRSVPRALVGNAIALCAACRAVARYRAIRSTGQARWDKTVHRFPEPIAAE